MCFSAKASLITFLIGIIGSLFLIYFGNSKFKKEKSRIWAAQRDRDVDVLTLNKCAICSPLISSGAAFEPT